MITDDTPGWWHGCWLQAGHHMFARRGYSHRECPLYNLTGLDTGFTPMRHQRTGNIVYSWQCGGFDQARQKLFYRSEELPQGQFLRHYFRDCTMLTWWDRSQGDTRGNCNSCYIVKGEHTSTEMLEWFPKFFPAQVQCIAEGGPVGKKERVKPYQLVEVFTTPTEVYKATCGECKKQIYETRYPIEPDVSLFNHSMNGLLGLETCKGAGSRVPWVVDRIA